MSEQTSLTDMSSEKVSQPDWIHIGTSRYDCGECGYSFLDIVGDAAQSVEFFACIQCGYHSAYVRKFITEPWF